MSLAPDMIKTRLEALHDELEQLDARSACAWPVARVFNALLAETRALMADDPVVSSMGSVKPADKTGVHSVAENGTVRTLARQLSTALESNGAAGAGG